jgi:hypothetical protein
LIKQDEIFFQVVTPRPAPDVALVPKAGGR